MEKTEKFASLVRSAERIVFFGGAGVSTESGLKDYRSEDGIYHTALQYGAPPEEILSHEYFMRHTETFYRFYRDYFMAKAEPNAAHRAIAALEARGKTVDVVTQNIDGLHQAAGSSRVFELHGTTSRYYCLKCGAEYGAEALRSPDPVPKCACGGVLKPRVVLYGEPLEEAVVEGAVRAIEKADLMIIGGTSMAVYPAASFVRYFRGGATVIINREPTPYDNRADLVFHEPIGTVLSEMMKRL